MPLIKIEITRELIAQGGKSCCWSCPIALGLFFETGFSWAVEPSVLNVEDVSRRYSRFVATYIRVESRSPYYEIPLPTECGRFIERFDDGRIVHPFAFDFELPDELATP